jgi:fermentation-respiration switch protein FrsA (DUF1100 family)
VEGAPASIAEINQRRYPFFPMRLLMRNRFDAVLKVAVIDSPLLVVHSPEDDVVPISEGRRLFEAARGDKAFLEVRGGHLGAADRDRQRFVDGIRQFLQTSAPSLKIPDP